MEHNMQRRQDPEAQDDDAGEAPIVQTVSLSDHSTLKVAVDPGYSIHIDDSPNKLQIRIIDRRSPSPPPVRNVDSSRSPPSVRNAESSRSLSQWMADYGPPRWYGDNGGENSRMPASHFRSNTFQERAEPVGFIETTCEKCGGLTDNPTRENISPDDQTRNSSKPTASTSSSDFIDCQRPNKNSPRNRVFIEDSDFREIHPDPSSQQPKAQVLPPQTSRMPSDETYNPTKYSSPLESPRSGSPSRCSWHKESSCPVTAGYRCRDNMGYESGGNMGPSSSSAGGGGGLEVQEERCSYHRKLSCPATAGVRCRCENSSSPKGDSKNEFILNSCKCEDSPVRRPSKKQAVLPSCPQAGDIPTASCDGK